MPQDLKLEHVFENAWFPVKMCNISVIKRVKHVLGNLFLAFLDRFVKTKCSELKQTT